MVIFWTIYWIADLSFTRLFLTLLHCRYLISVMMLVKLYQNRHLGHNMG